MLEVILLQVHGPSKVRRMHEIHQMELIWEHPKLARSSSRGEHEHTLIQVKVIGFTIEGTAGSSSNEV